MQKYKFSVSKGQSKYTIVVSGETLDEAREKVHKEGYSILSVEEYQETNLQGEKFVFQVLDPAKKEIKSGTIIGNDIFKVYLKLKKELGYDILYIFPEKDKNAGQEEKDKVMSDLKEQFEIFEKNTNNKQEEKKEIDVKNEQIVTSDFHLKKDLENTYQLIEFVLKKLQNILEGGEKLTISEEKKEKLQEIYNNIIKIKKSTNIAKLKQIGELGLVKVGQIELENVEKYQKEDARSLLKETNSLLKQIGSKETFIEESKDIKKIIGNIFSSWTETIERTKNIKEAFKSNKVEIDKTSYSYLKTLILLSKYKERLRNNTKEIYSNIHLFIFPFGQNLEKKEYILLKRKVIKQNISLLTAKKSGKVYSYTFIKKGYNTVIGALFQFLTTIKNYIFGVLYFYVLCCILFFNAYFLKVNVGIDMNTTGIVYFVFFLLIFLTISLSKNIFSLAINFVFFLFLFIFGIVNF